MANAWDARANSAFGFRTEIADILYMLFVCIEQTKNLKLNWNICLNNAHVR